MATIIYTKDESGEIVKSTCEADKLQGLLALGYVVDPSDLEDKEPDNPGDKWKGYSNEEIRQLAADSGIEGYKTARINKLKSALDSQE